MFQKKISDQQLISEFLSGNSRSIEYLILRHKDKVFSFIISKVKNIDLANDLFQDIFMKIIDKLREGRYNEEGKFISWVMRVSHNMIMDHFRKEARNRILRTTDNYDTIDVLAHDIDDKHNIALSTKVVKDLNILITHLSPNQRKVLKMRYFSSMTFKEISEESGISINTALGRMRYAIMNLRKLQKKYQINLTA